jgi:hypothetical protein
MDHYLANKIIEDLMTGAMSPQQGWINLQECCELISDEKHDEIAVLITEILLEHEAIEEGEDVELENFFTEVSTTQDVDDEWDDCYYQGYWGYDNNLPYNPEEN